MEAFSLESPDINETCQNHSNLQWYYCCNQPFESTSIRTYHCARKGCSSEIASISRLHSSLPWRSIKAASKSLLASHSCLLHCFSVAQTVTVFIICGGIPMPVGKHACAYAQCQEHIPLKPPANNNPQSLHSSYERSSSEKAHDRLHPTSSVSLCKYYCTVTAAWCH